MNDDEFEDWGPDPSQENTNWVLIISILVAAVLFFIILGVSCLGRECTRGHDGACVMYEDIQKAKEWAAENL